MTRLKHFRAVAAAEYLAPGETIEALFPIAVGRVADRFILVSNVRTLLFESNLGAFVAPREGHEPVELPTSMTFGQPHGLRYAVLIKGHSTYSVGFQWFGEVRAANEAISRRVGGMASDPPTNPPR